MNHHGRQNVWVGITLLHLPLMIGAAATLLALIPSAPARSDWWPYTTAPAPFTLKIQVTDCTWNPAGNLKEVTTQAQRSDGATVTVYTVLRTFRAVRLPDGTKIRLVDAISAKSTCRPKLRELATVRETLSDAPRPPNCLGPLDKLLGQTVLFSQQVDIVKTWDRGSGGQEWLAPGLGCKEFQWQNAVSEPDGSRKIGSEGKPVRFSLGEPDPRLFDLGASYAEVRPSELLRREMRASGVRWNSELAKEAAQQDEGYAAACQMSTAPPQ